MLFSQPNHLPLDGLCTLLCSVYDGDVAFLIVEVVSIHYVICSHECFNPPTTPSDGFFKSFKIHINIVCQSIGALFGFFSHILRAKPQLNEYL